MIPGYDSDKHHRRSIRLPGYDYSQAGVYFVTVCAYGGRYLFGDTVNHEMRLNWTGRIVQSEWLNTPRVRPNVELDQFVVMPNHLHALIWIHPLSRPHQTDNRRGVLQYAPTGQRRILRSPAQTVGAMVRGFRAAVTKHINAVRGMHGMPVWQRNYYEHIVRDEEELKRIRQYIVTNPAGWAEDEENPARRS